jgi:hypothetical protein
MMNFFRHRDEMLSIGAILCLSLRALLFADCPTGDSIPFAIASDLANCPGMTYQSGPIDGFMTVSGMMVISECKFSVFSLNPDGSVVRVTGGDVTLTKSEFDHVTGVGCSVIKVDATCILTSLSFSDIGTDAEAILATSSVQVSDCSFTNVAVTRENGKVVDLSGPILSFSACHFTSCQASLCVHLGSS